MHAPESRQNIDLTAATVRNVLVTFEATLFGSGIAGALMDDF